MMWILIIFLNLLIGIFIGSVAMHYKNRHLLKNQKILHSKLQSHKITLNEYEKKLKTHFETNMELLNNISKNYQSLYKNITKNAKFFLPNIFTQDNIYPHYIKTVYNKDEKKISVEVPRDYSEDSPTNLKNKHNID